MLENLKERCFVGDESVPGLAVYPNEIQFGVINGEGIYCIPFALITTNIQKCGEYVDLERPKHPCIEISDV
jgi:hypothetical protein